VVGMVTTQELTGLHPPNPSARARSFSPPKTRSVMLQYQQPPMPEFDFTIHARDMLAERKMRLKIDKESDALYLRLDEAEIFDSEEVQPGVILDFNKDNRVVGIEILNLSTRVAKDMLNLVQLETV
jgi:uncharacterized protein YuzE